MSHAIKGTVLSMLLLISTATYCQTDADAFFLKEIYTHNLSSPHIYDWLTVLSEHIGGRLAGSEQALLAVHFTEKIMQDLKLDSVRLQECTVPVWQRGKSELAAIIDSESIGSRVLNVTSLGNSIGSNAPGIFAQLLEVHSLDELKEMSAENVRGKIIFFNRPMDPTKLNTFHAYGGAVDQRARGPAEASKKGAVATLVRSMTTNLDDVPHTGVTIFNEGEHPIPALAVSTNDAELLSTLMKTEDVSVYIENHSSLKEDTTSYNVIGEIVGTEYPEEIILIGGHLDSWDLGGGAHDDGAGCVHAIQVLATLLDLGYKPKRTIRCVMFMNEENGLGGALRYAKESDEKGEYHMAAIESDSGGFTPKGFTVGGLTKTMEEKFPNIRSWIDLLGTYELFLAPGGGGADINPLKSQGGLLFGLKTDSQRYFDFHHTANDRIEAVNQRELQLGAAAMTGLVYLLDKYGIHGE